MGHRTPLYDKHVALGARIVDFSGWDMPVQYPSGILKEHAATREHCGVFDTCHMGEFLFEGEDVRQALNEALAGNFAKLKPGRERYTFITNAAGGVVDDAVVMILSKEKAWMVVNAGDIDGDFAAICAHLPERIEATNISARTAKIDVQGPDAHAVVQAVIGQDFRTMPFYSFVETEWKGEWMILSRSGYTGEPGVELYVDAARAADLWDAILATEREVLPCGLGARDTLRLEAGLPLYGHELTPSLNPVQAGFGKFVALDKEESFPGKEALLATEPEKVLVGLEMEGKRVPRAECPVLDGEETVGEITSGAPAPTVGGCIALAYVKTGRDTAGTPLQVDIRGKATPATVVELPFYSNPQLRKRLENS